MITKLIKRGFYNNESSLGSFYKTNYYRPETIKTGETTETQILSGIKTKYFSTVWCILYGKRKSSDRREDNLGKEDLAIRNIWVSFSS